VKGKVSLDAHRVVKVHSIELVELVEGASQEMEDRDRMLWPVRIEFTVTGWCK